MGVSGDSQMAEKSETTGAYILEPSCNLSTVLDGRGGIFTFIPDSPLVEINLIYIKTGRSRGFHFHKHFTEYFLIVRGKGYYVTQNEDGQRKGWLVSGGEMLVLPPYTPHVVYALDDMICVAGLTTKWDDCPEPITMCLLEDM
jgi:mannose-6-phosphate isomerase-like protein (cupin superfamily)